MRARSRVALLFLVFGLLAAAASFGVGCLMQAHDLCARIEGHLHLYRGQVVCELDPEPEDSK